MVFDDSVIDPAYPDYDQMRQVVQDALARPAGPGVLRRPRPQRVGRADRTAAEPSTTAAEPGHADVGDACAYDPVTAQEALDKGEPPTKNG